MTLEVKFVSKFESIFETALDQESIRGSVGYFRQNHLDKKISGYCPFQEVDAFNNCFLLQVKDINAKLKKIILKRLYVEMLTFDVFQKIKIFSEKHFVN
jgi:hypothetical protein